MRNQGDTQQAGTGASAPMPGLQTIADLVDLSRATEMAGRERELCQLQGILDPGGPSVAYLHGPYGIGKSALIGAFARRAAERGTRVFRITGGSVEPQPEAVLASIANASGVGVRDLAGLAGALAETASPVVLVIDDVDALRLVASWLRRELVPALPRHVRVILAGRAPPPPAWTAEYGSLFMALHLLPLPRDAVREIARRSGLASAAAERLWEISAGHPLGLRMALQALRSGLDEAPAPAGELAEVIVAASSDPALATQVEAAAVVRRVSLPLMTALLGGDVDLATFVSLPFVQRDREGYYLAEPVRRHLADKIASTQPDRHAFLRTAAAQWITARLAMATVEERWRHMADLLHLVEHAQVRQAFFPPDHPAPPVEPAEYRDFEAIFAIAEARAGAGERKIAEAWAGVLPHRFSVARGTEGEVQAFYVFARDDDPIDEIALADPLLTRWRTDAAGSPVQGGLIFLRQLMAADPAEHPPAWAACTLDVKREYFRRWDLSRVYCAARAETIAGPFMRRLGFRPLSAPVGGLPGSMVLDLPAPGLIGWISALVGVQGADRPADAFGFIRDRREVTVAGEIVRLTRLEAEVLGHLLDRAPAVATRDELIETVWRRAFVGSNVVDAVVRTLRRKLGPEGERIVTVPKAGYRYAPARAQRGSS